jgi:anti-anti-sigma factor
MRARRPMPEPNAIVVEIAGRIDRADIPSLCERVSTAIQASDADVVMCDVGRLSHADCVVLDAMARLQVTVGRLGCRLRLRGVSPELWALLRFVGLAEVLGRAATSGVEVRRQPE